MQRLTPAAVAAMDLIKPTLWAANQGGVSAAAARALVQHYDRETVAAAFACLRRLVIVNPGSGRRPYNLSEPFVRSQQASGLRDVCRCRQPTSCFSVKSVNKGCCRVHRRAQCQRAHC